MKRYETIKKHSEFNEIINSSKYIKNEYFVIYYRDTNSNTKFGIAISNKFGKAHIRNYYKRITRVFRNSLGIDFHILKDSFKTLVKEIINEKNN